MSGRCDTCGAVLSDDYLRVNGDRNGRVSTCPHCPETKGWDAHLKESAPPGHV